MNKMKFGFILVAAATLSAVIIWPAGAEMTVVKNRWGPGHRAGPPHHAGYRQQRHHNYYYYPGQRVYYDRGRRLWYWHRGNYWHSGPSLPVALRALLGAWIALTLPSERPYLYHRWHHRRYPEERYRHRRRGRRPEWERWPRRHRRRRYR